MKSFAFLSLFVSLVFTQGSPNVYWNSLATDVTVGVPLVDDPTLIGGRIQIKVSFNGGKSYEEMGEIFSTTSSASLFLNSEKSFPENSESIFFVSTWLHVLCYLYFFNYNPN